MSSSLTLYAVALLAVVIGIIIIKKVTSCLIKSIVLLVLIALAAFIYFTYCR